MFERRHQVAPGGTARAELVTMNQQALATPPFFYYNPEHTAEPRPQQSLFTPHPGAVVSASPAPRFPPPPPMYVQDLVGRPETHMVERPAAAQLFGRFPPTLASSGPGCVISPRPMCHKPAAIFTERLDTECGGERYNPATPPLSTGSSVHSPPVGWDVLPTPTAPLALPLGANGLNGVKDGCETDVKNEILAGGDWARCGSPPLAPSEYFILHVIFFLLSGAFVRRPTLRWSHDQVKTARLCRRSFVGCVETGGWSKLRGQVTGSESWLTRYFPWRQFTCTPLRLPRAKPRTSFLPSPVHRSPLHLLLSP